MSEGSLFSALSVSGHLAPVAAAIIVWFFATGIVAWLDNRERSTFASSLVIAALVGLAGLAVIAVSMQAATPPGAYASFAGALMVWAWHEIAFLTGAAAGPRRVAATPGLSGWPRFRQASATVIHHEIALALTAAILAALCWSAPDQTGAQVFALLFVLRLSSKLNLFWGVPNMALEILPPHLGYLKSYFGPRRLAAPLVVSLAALAVLAAWLGWRAMAMPAGTGAAVGASLLFALALLGFIEHLFLALPFNDGALWRWAMPAPAKGPAAAAQGTAGGPAHRRKIGEGEGEYGF